MKLLAQDWTCITWLFKSCLNLALQLICWDNGDLAYCKNPKISDTPKFAVITLKVEQDGLSLE